MKILSIHWSICSSASMLIDGRIVAAAHEERFTRLKNDDSFPVKSIRYCLEDSKVCPEELDGVAVASMCGPYTNLLLRQAKWDIQDYLKEQKDYWYPLFYQKKELSRVDVLSEKIDTDWYPSDYWKKVYRLPDAESRFSADRKNIVADFLNISADKVYLIEHHRGHAAYSYYASPFRNEKVLAFTIDGEGDGLNATIGLFHEDGYYERLYQTGSCNIGRIYRYVTLLLGMKPNDHEYKVMGLAPYGKEKHAKTALDVFKSTLYVDGIEFKWRIRPLDSYFWFKERLDGVRFDNIAWALQAWVEDLLVEWVRNGIRKYGVHKVVISGGVAMNIKAIGSIAKLDEVQDLFVGGSPSDQSLAIGVGYCLAQDLSKTHNDGWNSENIQPLVELYLGSRATRDAEWQAIRQLETDRYTIVENPLADQVAQHLSQGRIIARCAGRAEFGQRSLGNRSILADPINLKVKEVINAMIKNRDFWMPFAPVVMDCFAARYLINPKNIQSPHMTVGYDTTAEGYDAMIAACHPADKTARAQILHKATNPVLYEILESFEKITGRGALINTSFNLHGHPIVNTPEDAVQVFVQSGLDELLLENYLVVKRNKP